MRAFSEVGIVVAFSFIPFFVSYFVKSSQNNDVIISQTLLELFGRGQIYLLAYALFGTIFYLAFVRGDKERHDARVFFGAIATLMMLPIVGFIGVDPTFSSVVNERVIEWGYWFYGGFAVIYYLLLFYIEIEPPSAHDILSNETKGLIERTRDLGEKK
ncbi:hypothetical protein [Parasphingorhabdus sp.]|uniref:hypothetical protein n=1 Tax=Parasphingorhabdus sp. TaxID=2709688 RepID=UPI003D27FB81